MVATYRSGGTSARDSFRKECVLSTLLFNIFGAALAGEKCRVLGAGEAVVPDLVSPDDATKTGGGEPLKETQIGKVRPAIGGMCPRMTQAQSRGFHPDLLG